MTLARVSAAVLLILAIAAAILYMQAAPRDGIRRINFAPAAAPAVESFIHVDAGDDYKGWRGYGWLDAAGPVSGGNWPGDEGHTWESRDNLNVIMRRGPDDLARGLATGAATFALDLAPGQYEVWLLSGDAGHLEYVPRDAYRILVEGAPVYTYTADTEAFIERFETPPYTDQLTHDDIWAQSIRPRFQWHSTVVDVRDGQLTVQLDGQTRDHELAHVTGDYAHTEARRGPATRYTGALNALVVVPYGRDPDRGARVIAEVDAWRHANLREKWPDQSPATAAAVDLDETDTERGYTAWPVNVLETVRPQTVRAQTAAPLMLRATPGEFVPVTFAVTPLIDLGETRVELNLYHASDPSVTVPVDDDLAYGVVRYAPVLKTPRGKQWQPGPAMIIPADHWDIRKGVTRQFWLTYRVPDDLPAGDYTGRITLQPSQGQASQLLVHLEILPFHLRRPTDLAIGMTYFSPAQYAAVDESAFWERVQAEFADMRAHNMTTVQYTGIRMDDYDRMDRTMSLYRAAGFEQPIDLLESYGVMTRLRAQGLAWESEAFQEAYVQFIRVFLEMAQQHDWPPIIINFGDEFTNRGIEEFGARVASNLKQLPGIVTAADVNGYKEMKLLASEVDIVAFNDGWDGPDGINAGRRLLNRETVDEILEAGATPWLVNIGMDRFSNGYWLWKMARLGVRGKIEWIYRGYNGMPYDSFDAEPLRTHAVYPGPDGTAVPSLDYERMRIGLDDLAYLNTLEFLVRESRDDPSRASAVSAAGTFIRGLDDMIDDDMSVYRGPGSSRDKHWPVDRYDRLRDEAIELILGLVTTD